jgi:E3 ubiquitin ligase
MTGLLIGLLIGMLGTGVVLAARATPQGPRRWLQSSKLWSVAEMPAAEIGRIVGVAQGLPTLVAPISGTPCLFYSVRVVAGESVLAEETRGVDFEVEDGTGVALVEAADAISALVPERFHNNVLTAPTERQIVFLESHGYRGAYLGVHYEEGIVEVGDQVAVLGVATRDSERRLHLARSATKLVIGNDPRALRLALPAARVRRS